MKVITETKTVVTGVFLSVEDLEKWRGNMTYDSERVAYTLDNAGWYGAKWVLKLVEEMMDEYYKEAKNAE